LAGDADRPLSLKELLFQSGQLDRFVVQCQLPVGVHFDAVDFRRRLYVTA
jgi:hypothetical protein